MGQQRTHAPQHEHALLDHLVRAREQHPECETERLRGLEIDDEIELGRLFDRDVA